MEIKLNEGFSVQGSDINAFFDTLRSMDECTKLTTINTQDITFAGVNDTETDINTIARMCYGGANKFDISKSHLADMIKRIEEKDSIPLSHSSDCQNFSPSSISYQSLKERDWEPELIRDVIKGSKMILKINGLFYAVSPSSVQSILNRAGIGGPAFAEPSFLRTFTIADILFNNPKMVTLATREIGNAKTVIAMHSEKYTYIPQTILIELYEKISECMGKVKCLFWEVNHKHSSCYVEFPDKGKDFADAYNLPEEVVPGLYIRTSDSGDSSLTVYGFWRVKNRIVGADTVRQIHKGSVDIIDFVKKVDNEIFTNYRKLPERLCDLVCIDCPLPTETIKSVFEQIDLKNVPGIGKYRCDELYRTLCNELSPSVNYTAYEIAMMIATISDRCIGISNDKLMKLRDATKKAIFADYTLVAASNSPILLTA